MDTRELIEALTSDRRQLAASHALVWWAAVFGAITLAAVGLLATLDLRSDLAAAAATPRAFFKFLAMATLAATAFHLARALSRPGEAWRNALACVAVVPILVIAAVIIELMVVPPEQWAAEMAGGNSLACMTDIILLGLGPLAILLLALRHGAPSRPALAGAVTGLLAGGIAATFYASHCTDDSPLFVVTWYFLAIGLLALAGSAVAHRFCRW